MLDHTAIAALAKRMPTPFYVYSAGAIRRRIAALQGALRGLDATICYAVKANPNLAVIKLMAGVSIAEARRWFAAAGELTYVRLDGLHVHIGSQILELGAYRTAFERVASLHRELASLGHRIDTIDVGGGLGVCYRPADDRPIALEDYVEAVRSAFEGFRGRFILEPGRCLVGEAGALVARVIRVKEGATRRFLILDAAMNDLMRPALYDAWHEITPLHATPHEKAAYDVVGPVCETGDTFATGCELPACAAGDIVLLQGAGAYGASMSSTYNSRPLLAEVLLDGHRYSIIRRRQTYEEMWAAEQPNGEWCTT